MKATTITHEDQRTDPGAAFVERGCTIGHDGRSFEAGGAYRVGTKALVYVSADGTRVTTWHGEPVGWAELVSQIKLPKWSYVSGSYIYSYRVRMHDYTEWYGRGGGRGMALSLRQTKASREAEIRRERQAKVERGERP